MVLRKFNKNITCTDSAVCAQAIQARLEALMGVNKLSRTGTTRDPTDEPTDKQNGHISIVHKQGDHTIWVFLYDRTGEHESEDTTTKQIRRVPAPEVEAFTGTKPTRDQLRTAA